MKPLRRNSVIIETQYYSNGHGWIAVRSKYQHQSYRLGTHPYLVRARRQHLLLFNVVRYSRRQKP